VEFHQLLHNCPVHPTRSDLWGDGNLGSEENIHSLIKMPQMRNKHPISKAYLPFCELGEQKFDSNKKP
jgi:hypothetical protein